MKISRKIVVLFLVFALISGNFVFASDFGVTKSGNEYIVDRLDAVTVKDLDSEGRDLNPKNSRDDKTKYISSKIVDTKINVNNNQITFEGNLKKNEEIPFNLQGELKKPHNHKRDIIIGDLVDATGNFEVIFFAIDRNPEQNVTANFKNILNKRQDNEDILKIYLREKETRNLTVVEVINPIGTQQTDMLFENIEGLSVADFHDQNWYIKMLKPIKKYKSESPVEATEMRTLTSVETADSAIKNYTVIYEAVGVEVTEFMKVYFELAGLDVFNGESNYTTVIKIQDQSTFSTPYTDYYNSGDTSFHIGKTATTDSKVVVEDNVRVKQALINYNHYTEGTITLAPYVNVGTGINLFNIIDVSLNVSAEYVPASVQSNSDTVIMWDTTESGVGVEFEAGKTLSATTNKYSIAYTIIRTNIDPGYKTLQTGWTYSVYNAMGPEINNVDPGAYITNFMDGVVLEINYTDL